MSSVGTQYVARATTDAQDRVIEIDGPLASLNQMCGGELGSTLAVPELLSLVVKAREFGLRLSRQFEAIDGDKRITAWAEISPEAGEGGGCDIAVSNWTEEEFIPESSAQAELRKSEISRHLAECTARLDSRQRIFSIETDAADLVDFAKRAGEASGTVWTELVQLQALEPDRVDHWKELDGAQCRIPGSQRQWTAHLEPLGQNMSGKAGFVLHLCAAQPIGWSAEAMGGETPSLGRDLTPVLRQPVNRIIANAETIRTKLAGPLKDEYSEYAADIASAGQHLLALIDDLSDLEVVEAQDFVTAPDHVDLADVARRACGILGVKAQERRITLHAPEEDQHLYATAEFRRVLQVLLNLVGNAIRYSPEQSRVSIVLQASGQSALVTVADEGQGLDDEQQRKVFEKFERLGRAEDGGSGLGLYISRRIARAMGGDLTVESKLGKGARFTLRVPLASAQAPA